MNENIHQTPAGLGLLRCMQMLEEEAADLRLTSTSAALRQAIDACRLERARMDAALLH